MIDVIIFEIENEGNLGAISRVMANFNFKNLILINPKCSKDSIEVIKRAKHSKEVLGNIKVAGENVLDEYDYLIATTAKLGNDYNIPRSPITPKQLSEKLNEIKDSKIALLIGREGDGLTNEEIKKCDFIVTIPTSKKYPTLNISHALGILLYELSEGNVSAHIVPISKKDKEIILELVDKVLGNMEFATKEKKETQRLVWKRLIGKSFLTKREAFALIGFLKKLFPLI